MFPLKDDIPSRTFPGVTIGIIILNTLVFFYELSLSEQQLFTLLFNSGFIPARFFGHGPEPKELFSIFSSLFLHGGVFHLLSNMWMLWIFGDNVEDCMGHGRYLAFFLLCGVVSVLGQGMTGPESPIPLIGASGAISGVLGAYFLTYPQARVLTLVPIFIIFYTIELPAFFFLGFWFFMQFLQGSASLVSAGDGGQGGIAWWAHIWGFAAGIFLLAFFRDRDRCRGIIRRRPGIHRVRRGGWQ